MKIITTTILGLLLMITIVSATSFYSGESYNLEIKTTNQLYFEVIGNTSNADGIEINQEVIGSVSNVTINFDPLMKTDSFTMVFFDREKVIETINVGGGSSSGSSGGTYTKYVDRNVTEYIYLETPEQEEETIDETFGEGIEEVEEEVKEFNLIKFIIGIIIIILGLTNE